MYILSSVAVYFFIFSISDNFVIKSSIITIPFTFSAAAVTASVAAGTAAAAAAAVILSSFL